MRMLGRHIFKMQTKTQLRSQSLATTFFRNLRQLQLLTGPLGDIFSKATKTRVLVTGCSLGCEAYSLGGFLASRFPDQIWQITATDIDKRAIDSTRTAIYQTIHGLGKNNNPVVDELESIMFERRGSDWIIRDQIRKNYVIEEISTLDLDFSHRFHNYDLVFAQNYLIHMNDEDAEHAFSALVTALRPGGALFIGGIDLDLKIRLCKKHQLRPVVKDIKAIHEEDDLRRPSWPWKYWALEPFDGGMPDTTYRYATVFTKPVLTS